MPSIEHAVRHPCLPLLALLALLAPGSDAFAQWRVDGVGGGVAPDEQAGPQIAADGNGGTIVTWHDNRNSTSSGVDIYAQRVDAWGNVLYYSPTGVPVCVAPNEQTYPQVISDGTGGALIAWNDNRAGSTGDLYAQRLDPVGSRLWGPNGVAVCTAVGSQGTPGLVSDGAGGVILVWDDVRSGTYDVYAQRISGAGVAQWTANGVAIATATANQRNPVIVSDGAGGAIMAWEDTRFTTAGDLYGQRVNALGVAQWTAGGIPLCTVTNAQLEPRMIADGTGGAILAWQDMRNTSPNIFAQRVTGAGVPLWGGGIALCTNNQGQTNPVIATDGAGGAVVAWIDHRSGNGAIYAQRVMPSRDVPWTEDGVRLTGDETSLYQPVIAADGSGGAVVAWWQQSSAGSFDVIAQRVDASGVVPWDATGVPVCTHPGTSSTPRIAADSQGNAVVAWEDYRIGSPNSDVYIQRIEVRHGAWGHPEPALDAVVDVPLDQGGRVSVRWRASDRDAVGQAMISHYSIWRATDAVEAASAKAAGMKVVELEEVGIEFRGPALRADAALGADFYWELVGTPIAAARGAYAFTAATAYDSTSQGPAAHRFQVVAHDDASPYVHWTSNIGSGYSVDDLVPPAPLFLTAQRVGSSVVLRWSRVASPDLRDYAVYRANGPGVSPVPTHFLASAGDTVLVDPGAPGSALHYVVTAMDVHENQSTPSNEAIVAGVTGAGGVTAIPALTLLPNRPNPFAGATELSIGLPVATDLAIELHDLAGRRVRALSIAGAEAGWHRIPLTATGDDGRPLAGGIYFCRVAAAGVTAVQRIVIAR
jgi:hypothetical protein